MKSVNIQDAKPLTAPKQPDRPLGALRGAVVYMPDDFNAALSPDELAAFTHGNAATSGK